MFDCNVIAGGEGATGDDNSDDEETEENEREISVRERSKESNLPRSARRAARELLDREAGCVCLLGEHEKNWNPRGLLTGSSALPRGNQRKSERERKRQRGRREFLDVFYLGKGSFLCMLLKFLLSLSHSSLHSSLHT